MHLQQQKALMLLELPTQAPELDSTQRKTIQLYAKSCQLILCCKGNASSGSLACSP